MSELPVIPIERVDARISPRAWAFSVERRAEIDAHFAELQRRKPMVWNGQVLMLGEYAIEGATFQGVFFETDFARFVAWHLWDFPDDTVKSCFPLGALPCDTATEQVGDFRRGHKVTAGAELRAPGAVITESRRIQREIHETLERQPAARGDDSLAQRRRDSG